MTHTGYETLTPIAPIAPSSGTTTTTTTAPSAGVVGIASSGTTFNAPPQDDPVAPPVTGIDYSAGFAPGYDPLTYVDGGVDSPLPAGAIDPSDHPCLGPYSNVNWPIECPVVRDYDIQKNVLQSVLDEINLIRTSRGMAHLEWCDNVIFAAQNQASYNWEIANANQHNQTQPWPYGASSHNDRLTNAGYIRTTQAGVRLTAGVESAIGQVVNDDPHLTFCGYKGASTDANGDLKMYGNHFSPIYLNTDAIVRKFRHIGIGFAGHRYIFFYAVLNNINPSYDWPAEAPPPLSAISSQLSCA